MESMLKKTYAANSAALRFVPRHAVKDHEDVAGDGTSRNACW
jgi:hypothetical protein